MAGPRARESLARQPPHHKSLWRIAAITFVYLAVWTALELVSVQFDFARAVPIWYPPAGLNVALLLVLGVRFAPLLLVSALMHVKLISPFELSAPEMAVFTLATSIPYALAAVHLVSAARIDPRFPALRDVLWFIAVACFLAPLAAGAAQALLLAGAGVLAAGRFWISLGGFWAGAATGVAVICPPLLVAARRVPGLWPGRPELPRESRDLRVGPVETSIVVALGSAAVWFSYGGSAGDPLDYTYVVYLPALWLAMRGGLAAAAWGVLAINAGAVALTAGQASGEDGIALQFGLLTVTLVGLLLGALTTQRQAESASYQHRALHDALTGLPNRVLFADRLEHALARSERGGEHRVAVLFIDLDRFKSVNDSFGHAAGDRLLIEVGRRLRRVMRPGDTVARLGGDEFAVLLEDLHHDAEVVQVADRVLAALADPLPLADTTLTVTASVGSAVASPGAAAPETALHDADVALNRAKATGRGRHVVFARAMRQRAEGSLRLEGALRDALAQGALDLAFQPIVGLPRRQVVGMEALARWTPAGSEPVPPSVFIGVAEQAGLMTPLGRFLLRRTCEHAVAWGARFGDPRRVAVNVSPLELRNDDYAEWVVEVVASTGLDPARLELEITETQWLEQDASTRMGLRRLGELGVRIVLDDFGAGYSSFGYLSELPIAGLKVDRSFVAGLPHRAESAVIVRAILAMAAELGLNVTAEGVETAEQLAFLEEHGCPEAQGYLLGRPAAAFPA